MIKIQVVNASPLEIAYTDKKTGRPASFYLQTVYAFTYDRDGNPAPYPEKVEISLDRDTNGAPKPYAVGDYTLHPSALYVDSNGRLSVAPRLVPVKRTA
jgi:hypothetical protein